MSVGTMHFSKLGLWLWMTLAIYSMQQKLISITCRIYDVVGLVMSHRNILLMFVFTLTLKPLILSLLLYAGAALSKYSLLQDILDIPLLAINGICLVIVGGCSY